MDQAIKLRQVSASKNKQRHNNKHHSFSIETWSLGKRRKLDFHYLFWGSPGVEEGGVWDSQLTMGAVHRSSIEKGLEEHFPTIISHRWEDRENGTEQESETSFLCQIKGEVDIININNICCYYIPKQSSKKMKGHNLLYYIL